MRHAGGKKNRKRTDECDEDLFYEAPSLASDGAKREQIADMKVFFSKIKRRPWEKTLQEAASMREKEQD